MKNPKPPKPANGNDEPKLVFSITIEQFDNGQSKHTISNKVPGEVCRDLLFRHMMLIEEQIIATKIQQQAVKLVKPDQIPPGMKLHS